MYFKNFNFFILIRTSCSVTKEVHDILETYPLKLDESEASESPTSSTSDKPLESQSSQSWRLSFIIDILHCNNFANIGTFK